MCGIAGIVGTDGLGPDTPVRVAGMMQQIRHRGPDGSGTWQALHCALGDRRLAILDLSGGGQPIQNESGNLCVVANGEIYDFLELREGLAKKGHRFRTAGDSETVVHLYEEHGDGFVEYITGMFAIGLWDAGRRRLVLARDRLGVKPLYWHFDGKRLVFASELKGILAAGVDQPIDETALHDYLAYGFIPAPKTIFRNVHKLPAGHLLVFEDGRVVVRRYWDLIYRGVTSDSAEACGEMLWESLRAATRRRMIAEVPVGAFLSGGLDSSSVTACMAELSRGPVTALTCGFDDAAHDETEAATTIATRLACRHIIEPIHADAAAIVDRLAWHFDEPFADSSAIPTYYISRAAKRHATVILSGDGGDEVLAGYRRYRFDVREQAVRRMIPGAVRRTVFGSLGRFYPEGTRLPRVLRARATLRNIACDGATGHGLSIATMSSEEASQLLHPDIRRAMADYDPLDHVRRYYEQCDAPDHLSKCQHVDIKLGLADGILTKVDRASMALGVEVRSPMLDYRFVETAWTIPPGQRIRRNHGKHPLRLAAARRIGTEAAGRVKHGFEVPMARWFRGGLGEMFRDRLCRGASHIAPWVQHDEIKAAIEAHESGSRDQAATLWKLLMLDAWARQLTDRFAGGGRPSVVVPGGTVGAGV